MLDRLTPRLSFGLIAAACAGLMGYALYAEHVLGLYPCPLCMFQRAAVVAIGVVALIAALHGPGKLGVRIYGVLTALCAAIGAAIAGRHVWLTTLPADQVPACAPPLEVMMQSWPFAKTLMTVFLTSGDCAKIDWTFLGLSMPAWTLIWFIGLGLFVLWRVFSWSPRNLDPVPMWPDRAGTR